MSIVDMIFILCIIGFGSLIIALESFLVYYFFKLLKVYHK